MFRVLILSVVLQQALTAIPVHANRARPSAGSGAMAPHLHLLTTRGTPELAGTTRFTPADFSRALLTETNRVRRAHGRWPLRAKRELEAAADDQAAFMALTMQVRHDSFLRGQQTPADRVRRHGVWGALIAENVALTSLNTPPEESSAEAIVAALVDQWLKSPGHRENLLNPHVTHFGGSVRLSRLAGQWNAYGVQVFLREGSGFRG
jgi:uncharacterized protein YkwD